VDVASSPEPNFSLTFDSILDFKSFNLCIVQNSEKLKLKHKEIQMAQIGALQQEIAHLKAQLEMERLDAG